MHICFRILKYQSFLLFYPRIFPIILQGITNIEKLHDRFPFFYVNIIKIYSLLTHWPCGYFWNSSSFFVASKIFRHRGLKLITTSPYSGAWMLWLMLLRWTGVPLWCSAILYLIHGIKTSLKTCLSLVFGHLQFKFQ